MNQETRSILTCSLVGAIIGWAMGVAQLIYIGSWELIYWAWMPLIPIYSAVGGGLYGMIFGGGMFGPATRFLGEIAEEARRWAQPVSMSRVAFEASRLGTDTGLYGAGHLALFGSQPID